MKNKKIPAIAAGWFIIFLHSFAFGAKGVFLVLMFGALYFAIWKKGTEERVKPEENTLRVSFEEFGDWLDPEFDLGEWVAQKKSRG